MLFNGKLLNVFILDLKKMGKGYHKEEEIGIVKEYKKRYCTLSVIEAICILRCHFRP